ncbi:Vegetative incompatibility protein HET-E-1 [Colletotrichum spinosum]|uniref:Vegetative incompatibility protein HET-E-1 n=1 Tax=Colletotrichum spinosum TaxID=1347390 RepID=A0A4R8QV01_9PEZI|nr:Vegetative incompatibility protein HET-E-1 [Colletotrichum spinosum]
MEALGVVANVIAVVHLSAKLAALCGEYINKARNATKDIERLKDESEALAKNVTQVRDLLGNKNDKDEGHKRQLKASAEFHDDVTACEERLELLVTKLDPGSNPSRMKMLGKSLKWPFSGKEVMDNVESLRRWREAFATAIQVDQLRIAVRMDDDLDMRNLPEAEGAHFDAYDQEKEPFCHEETRKDLLRQINDWVDDPNGKCLFWLRGLAGTGKSTISRTVARNFAERNQLAASFFFNRTVEGRNNARLFATTIARDFIRRVPQLKDRILAVVKEDPELAGTILRTQFKKLVLEPLQHLTMKGPLTPSIVIVIDALDECDSETTDLKFDRSRIVVSLLADLATVTGVKVRVFLTSRPELPIRLGFRDDVPQDSHQDVALHDIPDAVIASDIRFFINSQLDVTRSLYRIPPSWPGANKIGKLVEISVPLFIYAATICRFLMDKRKPFPPQKRLDSLLSHTKRAKTGIEKTYKPILEQLLLGVDEFEQEDLLQQFRKVVGTIILLADPLPMVSLCKLLQSDPEEVEYFLGSFHSVLNIPDDVKSTQSIKLFHLSFREYLLDNSAGDNQFWVEQDRKHNELFELCVQVMTAGEGRDFYLKKDICSLDDPGIRCEDVDEEVVRSSIPRHLEYACLYWFHHLRNSQKPTDNETKILRFLKSHYIHWLEAMSWLGRVEQAIEAVVALDDIFRPMGSTTSDFIVDARQFLTQHKHAITVAPCQTYVSALLFSPLSSAVRQQFWCDVPEWVARAPDVPDSWDTSTRNIHFFTKWIKAMAYSQDGKLLAAATIDELRVWNSSSGTLVATCDTPESQRSGKNPISCLAFNPQGILAAGVKNEDYILSWDLQNNSINIHRVKEAGPGIKSLFIAANGRILCASQDGIVYLLDENFDILHDWQMCHEDSARYISRNGALFQGGIDDGVAFSADGAFVAVIETRSVINVYDGNSFCL